MGQLWLVIFFIAALVLISFLTSRERKKKIIFFGDGLSESADKPGGYICMISELMNTHEISTYKLEVLPAADLADLAARIEEFAIRKNPDMVVFVTAFGSVEEQRNQIDIQVATKHYRKIISRLQANAIKIIVATTISIRHIKNISDNYYKMIDFVAADTGVRFADLTSFTSLRETTSNKTSTQNINDISEEEETKRTAEVIWKLMKEVL